MKYNTTAICQDVDLVQFIRESGVPHQMRSGKCYIYCPDHIANLGKEDRNFGSCVVSKRGYYCFACGGKGNPISFCQQHYQINFREACELLIRFLGDPSLYLIDDSGERELSILLPFSEEEMSSIFLETNITIELPYTASDVKREIPRGDEGKSVVMSRHPEEYVGCRESHYSMRQFFQEDPVAFYDMVWGKTWEAVERWKKLIASNTLDQLPLEYRTKQKIENSIQQGLENCKSILAQYGYALELESKEWMKYQQRLSRFK